MTNRLLLATLVGLGALNSLLCVFVVSRENVNASSVQSLKEAAGQKQEEADRQVAGLRSTLDQTRKDLEDAKHQLNRAEANSKKLQIDLMRTAEGLGYFQRLPWLNGPPSSKPPWAGDIQKLTSDLEKMKEKHTPVKPVTKPPGP